MSNSTRKIIQQICDLLDEQCRVHSEYKTLLQKERVAITQFQSKDIEALAGQRETLARRIEELKNTHIGLISELSNQRTQKLLEAVEMACSKEEATLIKPKAEQLRKIINTSSLEVRNLGHLTQFALNMVHGSLSILWSATQKTVQSYAADGKLHQAFQPIGSRMAGIRREA